MPEHTIPASNEITESNDENESSTMDTCACGEQHRHGPGTPSHREACISPLKFGDTCCCGSGQAPKGDQHRCGQGPKCQ